MPPKPLNKYERETRQLNLYFANKHGLPNQNYKFLPLYAPIRNGDVVFINGGWRIGRRNAGIVRIGIYARRKER